MIHANIIMINIRKKKKNNYTLSDAYLVKIGILQRDLSAVSARDMKFHRFKIELKSQNFFHANSKLFDCIFSILALNAIVQSLFH